MNKLEPLIQGGPVENFQMTFVAIPIDTRPRWVWRGIFDAQIFTEVRSIDTLADSILVAASDPTNEHSSESSNAWMVKLAYLLESFLLALDYNMHRQCVRHHKTLSVLSTTFYVVQYCMILNRNSDKISLVVRGYSQRVGMLSPKQILSPRLIYSSTNYNCWEILPPGVAH